MNHLPSLKEFGKKLSLLKTFLKDGKEEQAEGLAQSIFENYVFAKDEFLRREDGLISARNNLAQAEDRTVRLESSLKEAYSAYNSDLQFFSKLCKAIDKINTLSTISALPQMIKDVARQLGVAKMSIVLDRDLCAGLADEKIPTFYLKGCMRYIDATLSPGKRRVFIGPISKMMRPDIFFGNPEITPESGGSCFAYGLINKYKPNQMIGLLAFYDPSESRYNSEMATDFLEHFSNVTASTLINVINYQRSEMLRQDVERITRHDLKTPLNAVINLPHILLQNEQDENRLEMLKTIQDSGYKMLGLINRSYDIYRMETGTYVLNPDRVDILPLIEHILKDLEGLIEFKQSELIITVDGHPLEAEGQFFVRGEELLLYSMLANLLKNALEATPEEKPVSISISSTKPQRIEIHNSGAVPDSIKEKFFEKYSTAGKAGGTGLGTYSASLIAKAHGGEITMTSFPVEGTTICITLP